MNFINGKAELSEIGGGKQSKQKSKSKRKEEMSRLGLGLACCSNPPKLDPCSGEGHVQKFGGLDSYLTGSPHSNRAILFVSDIFGILN